MKGERSAVADGVSARRGNEKSPTRMTRAKVDLMERSRGGLSGGQGKIHGALFQFAKTRLAFAP
jgi:hypothetical protein